MCCWTSKQGVRLKMKMSFVICAAAPQYITLLTLSLSFYLQAAGMFILRMRMK